MYAPRTSQRYRQNIIRNIWIAQHQVRSSLMDNILIYTELLLLILTLAHYRRSLARGHKPGTCRARRKKIKKMEYDHPQSNQIWYRWGTICGGQSTKQNTEKK